MSASTRRADTGAAVAGLFGNASATGGLAERGTGVSRPPSERPPARGALRAEQAARVRVGIELTEEQSGYLRALSRPGRTKQPRTLGTKFVATGVLVAAIELLREVDLDMHGVTAATSSRWHSERAWHYSARPRGARKETPHEHQEATEPRREELCNRLCTASHSAARPIWLWD